MRDRRDRHPMSHVLHVCICVNTGPGVSCRTIKIVNPHAKSGVYWIKPMMSTPAVRVCLNAPFCRYFPYSRPAIHSPKGNIHAITPIRPFKPARLGVVRPGNGWWRMDDGLASPSRQGRSLGDTVPGQSSRQPRFVQRVCPLEGKCLEGIVNLVAASRFY